MNHSIMHYLLTWVKLCIFSGCNIQSDSNLIKALELLLVSWRRCFGLLPWKWPCASFQGNDKAPDYTDSANNLNESYIEARHQMPLKIYFLFSHFRFVPDNHTLGGLLI